MKIETACNVVEIECDCCWKKPGSFNSLRRRPSIYYGKSKKEADTNAKAQGYEKGSTEEEKSNAKKGIAEGDGASSGKAISDVP